VELRRAEVLAKAVCAYLPDAGACQSVAFEVGTVTLLTIDVDQIEAAGLAGRRNAEECAAVTSADLRPTASARGDLQSFD
jgi:hypothetical protein